VRNVSNLVSKLIDEDAVPDKAKPKLPRAAPSRSPKAAGKNASDPLPPFIQEVCPSAPIDIGPFDIAQIARVGMISEPDVNRGNIEDEIDGLGPPAAEAIGRNENSLVQDVSNKPEIVVIHRRDFFRDCFVRCLKESYSNRKVCSFATIAEWCGSPEASGSSVAVVIIVIEAGEDASIADRVLIERTEGKVPVVVVSDSDDLDHILGALKRGARGYIPSSLPFNIAMEAVRLVEAGGVFVPASSLVDRNKPAAAIKDGVALTERQMKVLEEIRHGKANKQIAYTLNMSEHTVKLHLRQIMRKLKVRNRTEVAMLSENLLAAQKGV
jgi:DNA-binding NarL/FixJ family response regulator